MGRPSDGSTTTQQRQQLGLAQRAATLPVTLHEQEVVDLHALFLDARGKRRHGARGGAADVSVVAARAHVEGGLGRITHIDGGDHGHVRQVGAAVVGVIEHVHVTGLHAAPVFADHGLDAFAHAAQVHRHVGSVGNQVTFGVEQGTGKVQPLLDVDRIGRVLQLQAHLLGNVHEQVVEHFQQHRVHLGAGGKTLGARHGAHQFQVVERGQAGLPARLHDGGGVLLGDDGRSGNHVARAQILAHHQGRVMPGVGTVHPLGVHAHGVAPGHLPVGVQGQQRLGRGFTAHHRLHRHRFHHQGLARHHKGKALAVGRLKTRDDRCVVAKGDHQRGVAAGVAHMHPAVHRHRALPHLLALQFVHRGGCQRIQLCGNAGQRGLFQRGLHRLLTHHALIGETHAVGAEHARQRVHEHLRHAERVGHQAGVLATGAAKALQRVARHVVATRHRDFLDGVGHLLHGDADEALRTGFGAQAGLRPEFDKALAHDVGVKRLVGARAEGSREMRRLQLAHHDVGVGHGQRATSAVAGWSRVGARAFGPHTQACAVELQQRAATRRHGVDAHHGGTHANTGHLGFELALEGACVMAHIGGGAPHVETDDLGVPGQAGRARHAHDPAGWPGQDRVLALKHVGVSEAAGRLHEEQAHPRHFGRHLVHITAKNGREIGIHHRGVTPADEFHHRAGAVAGADLREAHLARQFGGAGLVRGVAVAVHEHDGHTAQTGVESGPQVFAQVPFIQGFNDVALGTDALLRLDHPLVQQFGQHDVAVKQAWPVLVGDAQRVAKTPGGHQQRGLALAFQQRVGGHGGAHLHAGHLIGRDGFTRPQAQQVPDARHGRIPVLLRVFAQQLVRGEGAIRPAGHDVGEGATAVDPELPARIRGLHGGGLHVRLRRRITSRRLPGRPGRRHRTAHAAAGPVHRCHD